VFHFSSYSTRKKEGIVKFEEGVQVTKRRQDYIEMQIQANLNPHVIVEAALHHSGVSRFEVTEPSLTDIFIEAVGKISLPDAPSTLSA